MSDIQIVDEKISRDGWDVVFIATIRLIHRAPCNGGQKNSIRKIFRL